MLIKPTDLETIRKLDLKQPYVWLATWFGAGFLRPAPGTWGSAIALPFALILFQIFGLMFFIAAIVAVSIAGYWASDHFERATQSHDNSMIVIDEVVGQWISLTPVFYFVGLSPFWVILAFFLFRFFDITKPWPVSYCDQILKGPLSVMLDDIVAGFLVALILMGGYFAGLS